MPQISKAQAAMPTGPVTHGKAWIEMIHRYLATGVGVLIVTPGGRDLGAAPARRGGQPLVADRDAGLGLPARRVRRARP